MQTDCRGSHRKGVLSGYPVMKLDYTNSTDRALMDLQRTKKYVRVQVGQFKAAEEAAIAAGLLQ
ncbi:MAG: hypothetical protein M5R38_05370 [Candidatus Methylomirabilis sp.]|nr:hypothetical protein [Candidatus Methylomirabilis sp.]